MARPALLLLLLAACGSQKLGRTSGSLHLREQSVSFPQAWVGGFSTAVVHLVNESASPLQAQLRLQGPFEGAPASLTVPGGATQELRLTFRPQAEGDAQGELTALLDQGSEHAQLLATAQADPTCSTPGPCHAQHFDPQSGRCVDDLAPDGTDCSDDCLLGATCQQGRCLGTPRACDDGDPCTADACEPGLGCVARPSPSACPVPADPCLAPSCDRAHGCGTTPVDDGVACGPADCQTAQVCLAGVCQAVSVPEGSECGTVSPCQHAGRCVDGSCQQEQPGDTRLLWQQDLDPSATLHWLAVADQQGNLYWAEHRLLLSDASDPGRSGAQVQVTLVSVTPDGYPRYRKVLGSYPDGLDENLKMVAVAHGGRLAVHGLPNLLQVLDTATGDELWRADFSDLLARSYHPDRFTGQDDVHVAQLVDDDDRLVVAAIGVSHTQDTDHPWGTWLRALDWQSGAALWEWTADGRSRRLVGDSQGNLYLSLWQLDTTRGSFFANGITNFSALVGGAVYALDREGQLRWAHLGDQALDLAAAGNRLFTDLMHPDQQCLIDQRLWYAAAGELAEELGTQVPWASFVYDWPLLTTERAYRLAIPARTDCSGGATDAWLRAFDASAGGEAWVYGSNLTASDISASVLGQDGSVAFATTTTDKTTRQLTALLRRVNADGSERYACPVVPFTVLSEPVALSGRWVVGGFLNPGWRVVAYDMPAFEPAASGWYTSRSNAQRTNRPR